MESNAQYQAEQNAYQQSYDDNMAIDNGLNTNTPKPHSVVAFENGYNQGVKDALEEVKKQFPGYKSTIEFIKSDLLRN